MWRALLLIFGVKCTIIPQEKPSLSPQFIDVLENRSLEFTCNAQMDVLVSQWGTKNQPGIFSDLIFSKEGECTTTGFLNDTKYFETACYSNASFQVRIKKVNISNHGQEWYCSSNFITSNSAYVVVQVPTKYVRFKNVNGDVLKTVEKIKTTLCCETSEGRPPANITWTKIHKKDRRTEITNDVNFKEFRKEIITERNLTIVQSSIYIVPVRADNDTRIICEATNRKLFEVRQEIVIQVQYPPSKPVFVVDERIQNDSIRIISGNNLSVICKSDSYPYPTYMWYTARSQYKGQCLNLTNITRNETFQCTTTNNMTIPNKTIIAGNNSSNLKIHVLFPTTNPVLSLEKGNYTLNGTLYVMRNDDVTLLCRSNGDPAPKCQWYGESQGALLHIASIQTNSNKTCIASNEMHETFGDVQTSSSKTSIAIVVSYPPGKPFLQFIGQNELAKNGTFLINKVILEEHSSFTVLCKADGFPLPTFAWKGHKTFKSSTLKFVNISKEFRGLYTCFAENLIKRSFPPYEHKMKTSTDLEIDVLYRSRVELFYIVRHAQKDGVFNVIEGETIIFYCSVDSNPKSSIVLSFRGKELGHEFSTKALTHAHRVTSCYGDDGDYKCAAQNVYNERLSFKELNLLVMCKPRVSPDYNLKSTISSARNITVTFKFKAFAKPAPEFLWFKLNSSSWNNLKNSSKYKIHTSRLHSNLSVRSITKDDYGYYMLTIQNKVGSLEQLYFLKVNGSLSKLHFMLSENGLQENNYKVNKNAEVSFMCFSDSDLPSNIVITRQDGKQITLMKNTTSIRYTIHEVSCDDAGMYECSSTNFLSLQQESVSRLKLSVKCPPMPSARNRIDNTVFSVLHTDVTLQFGTNEYFDESNNTLFLWYKQNVSIPNDGLNDGSKYIISSQRFQSNLVIRNVTVTDLGEYRVRVQNSYGQYIHIFELKQKDKENTVVGSTTAKTLLVVAICTFGLIVIVVVFLFFGHRYIRRERNDRTPSAEVVVNQITVSHDDNDVHYEEIHNVYEQLDEQLTEGANYIEMRDIESDDSTKYYITPTI